MQFLHILILLLVALVTYGTAQCPIPNASCRGGRNVGHGGRGCRGRIMWYYDVRTRLCHRIYYLGCGGNNNRWCTANECVRRCRG